MSRYAGATDTETHTQPTLLRLTGEHSAQSDADTTPAVTHSGLARQGHNCHFLMGAGRGRRGKAGEGNPGRAACPGG